MKILSFYMGMCMKTVKVTGEYILIPVPTKSGSVQTAGILAM